MKKILAVLLASGLIVSCYLFLNRNDPTPAQPKSFGSVFALGDSVAAGIGLEDYSDASACERTEQSYSKQLAQKLQFSHTSIACSGATFANGALGSQTVNKLTIPAQKEVLFSSAKPDVITVTLGANDLEWTKYIEKCYVQMCGSEQDTAEVGIGMDQLGKNARMFLEATNDHYSGQKPHVYITGYYLLFPAALPTACIEGRGIDPSELLWIASLQADINATLQAATDQYDFVTYVPIDFTNHTLCSTDPWIQGISSKRPYHPTERGQTAIADQIMNQYTKNEQAK